MLLLSKLLRVGDAGEVQGVLAELEEWEVEEGRIVPRPLHMIAEAEANGVVVDLRDGSMFVPYDSWTDFAERWVMEMVRRREVPACWRLGEAIYRAQAGRWSVGFCGSVAEKVYREAVRRVYAAQI